MEEFMKFLGLLVLAVLVTGVLTGALLFMGRWIFS